MNWKFDSPNFTLQKQPNTLENSLVNEYEYPRIKNV